MPIVEFVSQSSRDPANPQATGERLVNLYPEPMASGARGRFALKCVPGTSLFASASGVFVRALINAPEYSATGVPSDRLIMVSDGNLRAVSAAGVVSNLGAIGDDENTGLSTNNGAITVVNGGRYRVWNGTTLVEPAAGAFSSFGGVEFLNDYTILTERGDRRFCWSDLADAETLPALNFATAEARDDAIVRPVAIAGNLWLFKERSIEIWGTTGNAGAAAFTRVGPVIETGLGGFNFVAKIPGGAFFIGDDGIAYITGGTIDLRPVSTPAVNEAIKRQTVTNCFYYEATGHKFCVVRFKDAPALVFDLVTGAWHERATGDGVAWGATCAVDAYGSWRFGGFDGQIMTATSGQTDNGAAIVRRAVSMPLERGGERFLVRAVTVRGEAGRSDLGRPASVQMRVSRDGGMTWGPWRTASMGALGEYYTRAVFRSLGQARVFTVEVAVSDDAPLTLWSSVEVEAA